MDYYHHIPPQFRGYGVLPPPALPPPQIHPQAHAQHNQGHPQPHNQAHQHPQPQPHPLQHLQLPPQPQPQNLAQNLAQNVAQNLAQNVAQNLAQNVAQNLAQMQQPAQERVMPAEMYRPKPAVPPVPDKPKKKRRVPDNINTEWLIEEVKKRPACHYQRGTGTAQDENEQGWNDMSQLMGISADSLKKKWQYLRSGFMRTHRALLITTTDKVRENALKWKYYDQLQFLVSHLDVNKKYFSEAIEIMGNNADEPVLPSEESGSEQEEQPPNDNGAADDDVYVSKKKTKTKKLKKKLLAKKLKKVKKERKYPPKVRRLMRKRKKIISDDDPLSAMLVGKVERTRSPSPMDMDMDHAYMSAGSSVKSEKVEVKKKLTRKKRTHKATVSPDAVNDRILEIILQREDSDQKFLLSLLPGLKRLPQKPRSRAKLLMQSALGGLARPEAEAEPPKTRSNNNKVPNHSSQSPLIPVKKRRNKVISPRTKS